MSSIKNVNYAQNEFDPVNDMMNSSLHLTLHFFPFAQSER
jgi:hypothetical protein